MIYPHQDLREELEALLARHRQPAFRGTPEFILARFLTSCLFAFHQATSARDMYLQAHTAPDVTPPPREDEDGDEQ